VTVLNGDWINLKSAYKIWQKQSCVTCLPTRGIWVGVVNGVNFLIRHSTLYYKYVVNWWVRVGTSLAMPAYNLRVDGLNLQLNKSHSFAFLLYSLLIYNYFSSTVSRLRVLFDLLHITKNYLDEIIPLSTKKMHTFHLAKSQ
jgi:hypothetical protein